MGLRHGSPFRHLKITSTTWVTQRFNHDFRVTKRLFWASFRTHGKSGPWGRHPPFSTYFIPGWWFQPLWKILVSWDHYSQYMENKSHVPNHQPGLVNGIMNIFSQKIGVQKIFPSNAGTLKVPTKNFNCRELIVHHISITTRPIPCHQYPEVFELVQR